MLILKENIHDAKPCLYCFLAYGAEKIFHSLADFKLFIKALQKNSQLKK